jgi:hypothetical protein
MKVRNKIKPFSGKREQSFDKNKFKPLQALSRDGGGSAIDDAEVGKFGPAQMRELIFCVSLLKINKTKNFKRKFDVISAICSGSLKCSCILNFDSTCYISNRLIGIFKHLIWCICHRPFELRPVIISCDVKNDCMAHKKLWYLLS